jgi:hypothetical protein
VDLADSVCGPLAGSCEHGNERSGSMNGEKLLDLLSELLASKDHLSSVEFYVVTTLKMEAVYSCEMLVTTCSATRCNSPQRCENFKYQMLAMQVEGSRDNYVQKWIATFYN